MSYEYKDEIIMNLKDYHAGRRVVTGGTNAFESKLSELDHVYAQAALNKEEIKVRYPEYIKLQRKADEYEAKAEAFDRIVKESEGTFSCGEFCDNVRHIINSYEIGVARDEI